MYNIYGSNSVWFLGQTFFARSVDFLKLPARRAGRFFSHLLFFCIRFLNENSQKKNNDNEKVYKKCTFLKKCTKSVRNEEFSKKWLITLKVYDLATLCYTEYLSDSFRSVKYTATNSRLHNCLFTFYGSVYILNAIRSLLEAKREYIMPLVTTVY